MGKLILSSLLVLATGQLCAAADVTLAPNGKEVNINGSTVVCNATAPAVDLFKVPNTVVIGMAYSGKLGDCTVTEYNTPILYTVWLKTGTGSTEVFSSRDQAEVAGSLRDYYNAGACH